MSEEAPRPGHGVEAHRLHPLTVFLEVGRVLGRFAWFLVMILVVSSLGGRQADPAAWIFLLAGSGIMVAFFRYLSLRYWVAEGRLVIQSGIAQLGDFGVRHHVLSEERGGS